METTRLEQAARGTGDQFARTLTDLVKGVTGALDAAERSFRNALKAKGDELERNAALRIKAFEADIQKRLGAMRAEVASLVDTIAAANEKRAELQQSELSRMVEQEAAKLRGELMDAVAVASRSTHDTLLAEIAALRREG